MPRIWTQQDKEKVEALDKAIQQEVDREPYHKLGAWENKRGYRLAQNLTPKQKGPVPAAVPLVTLPIRTRQSGRPKWMSSRQWRKARDKGQGKAQEANRKADAAWGAPGAVIEVPVVRRKSVKFQRPRRGLQVSA